MVYVDELRVVRDELLASSDFTQLDDAPYTAANKALWANIQTIVERFTRWLYASGKPNVSYEAGGIDVFNTTINDKGNPRRFSLYLRDNRESFSRMCNARLGSA